MSRYDTDRWVVRLKDQPMSAFVKVPRVIYRCRTCRDFMTDQLSAAWTHSMAHGPWPEEGSLASRMMNIRPKNGDVDRLPTRYTGERSRHN